MYLCAGDCQQLNKVCDALINFKVTREELLRQAEVEVDSTTEGDTPVKKPRLESKVIKPAKAKPSEKKKLAFSKVEAAKSRAKEIFSQMAPPVESDLDSCSEEESDLEMVKQMREQQKLIATLKQQLQEKCKCMCVLIHWSSTGCAAVSLICWALWPCGRQICWALWPCGRQSDMLGFVAVRPSV